MGQRKLLLNVRLLVRQHNPCAGALADTPAAEVLVPIVVLVVSLETVSLLP